MKTKEATEEFSFIGQTNQPIFMKTHNIKENWLLNAKNIPFKNVSICRENESNTQTNSTFGRLFETDSD